ncbi:MAG: hypothetical protein IKK10_00880 [Clostridia bacterium]|nr:hypothetical protein [Clostridia bacterium]
MNNFKKTSAVFLAVLMLVLGAGCSKNPTWSYKTDNVSYAEGVYLYSLFSAYNEAYTILQEQSGNDFDSTASILDIKADFDGDGEEVLCETWINEQADIITRNLAALDEKIKEYGIKLDRTQVESARELAKEDWHLGPYYEYYVASGYEATSYEDMLSPYGISFDSFFTSSYLASVKQNAIFDYLYGKSGEEAVSDEEITKYFTDNYASYAYFTTNLYETSIDPETSQQKYIPYTEELIDGVEKEFKSYAKQVNSGAAYTEVMYKYMKAHNIVDNPTVKNIEILDNSSLGEEVLKAVKELKEGKATYLKVGTGDTSIMYFITRFPIADEAEEYLKADGNRHTILQALKSEDFTNYLNDITENVKVEVNEKVIEKYSPAIFETTL